MRLSGGEGTGTRRGRSCSVSSSAVTSSRTASRPPTSTSRRSRRCSLPRASDTPRMLHVNAAKEKMQEEDPERDRATPEEEEEVQMGPLSAREQIIYTVKCFVLSVLPLPSSVRQAGPWLDRYTRSGIFPRHSPTEQTIIPNTWHTGESRGG